MDSTDIRLERLLVSFNFYLLLHRNKGKPVADQVTNSFPTAPRKLIYSAYPGERSYNKKSLRWTKELKKES